MDFKTGDVCMLTTKWDNLLQWLPDRTTILFMQQVGSMADNYQDNHDIFTINLDSMNLIRLTLNGRNDAYLVWTVDGRIIWYTSQYGWRTEAATYNQAF